LLTADPGEAMGMDGRASQRFSPRTEVALGSLAALLGGLMLGFDNDLRAPQYLLAPVGVVVVLSGLVRGLRHGWARSGAGAEERRARPHIHPGWAVGVGCLFLAVTGWLLAFGDDDREPLTIAAGLGLGATLIVVGIDGVRRRQAEVRRGRRRGRDGLPEESGGSTSR
jgi:hypothetical protein